MPRILPVAFFLLAACSAPDTPTSVPGVRPLAVPAGVQAAGPRISGGGEQPVVLSWMEPDENGTTLWYSLLGNAGWGQRQAVVSGKHMFVNWADLPSVTALEGDHWVAHWLEMAGNLTYAYHVVMAQSLDGGHSWSETFKLHTDGTPTEHGFVSIYPFEGKAAAIWLDGRKTGGEHGGDPRESGMTLRSAVIDAGNTLLDEQELDDLICDCCQTDAAITAAGPVAVYRDRTAAEVRDIYVARHVDGRWQPGVPLYEDNWQIAGCPVNGPAIAAKGPQVAAAWFSAPDQTPAVRVRFSADSGATFGPALRLAEDGTLGHVDTVLLEDGSAVVSWLQAEADGRGNLVLRRVTPQGEMGPIVPVVGGAPARSVPQMVVAGDDLLLVWTDARGDARRIASARVPLPPLPTD